MKISLRQMEVFLEVARQGSVSQAAQVLAMSQSAASSAVGELERQFDLRLFDRVGRSVRLNALGEQLLPMAAELLDRASAVGAAYALSLGENPDDKAAARQRLAFARSGPPPPRGVMPAFALAHVAGFRLRAGRVARPPLTMPFRLFLCTLARRT